MKWLQTLLFFFFAGIVSTSFSQSLNDYRTVTNATGNWTTVANWEVYDGTNWVPATNYPGQVVGTNNVTIVNGAKITLNTTIASTQPINSITIGDGSGIIEELIISGTTPGVNTTELNILTDGLLHFNTNGSDTINLPANTNITIDPSPSATLGIEHGLYNQNRHGRDCNDAADKIVIGGVTYSNCKGSGPLPSFEEVNEDGGTTTPTLNVQITYSGTPCVSNTFNLTATPGGTAYDSNNPTTYTWSSSPSTGNITNINSNNTTATPTTSGVIVYEVTISNSGYTASRTLSLLIENCPTPSLKNIITNRRITYRVNK
ncbi:hypothetical protein [Tenacibaculum singaporense]|uniref:hypothetical protein n=1 Tax=Tenacibaculum singaporense TaxID=2358479 RepID=UPI000F688F4E|nr:hypothetical protein [Tenacibaculum singaporense]RSC92753.1 hypothetical protein EI424_13290 [Tenacibaculum singaporense]